MKSYIVPVCSILAETSPQALPLGAACIVSAINKEFSTTKNSNFCVKSELCVFSMENLPSIKKIAEILLEKNPRVICFSVFVWNHPVLVEVAREIKETNKQILLIAGGPEVTARASSFSDFDFLVTGEGEVIVPNLIRKILKEENFENCSKIFYGKRSVLANLSSPYLDGTLKPEDYDGGILWELARGCPFKCSYCYESKGEKTVDYFPMERILKELQFFQKSGVRQVFVLDPTYNAQKKRALEMLENIRKITPNIFYHFECRAEFLDVELAKAFASISCSLQIGLQSSNENVLKLVNRNFNRKEFIKKIGILNKYGVIFGFDLIYGLPGDSFSSFKESIDFALSLYPNSLELFRLSVLPGTTLYDQREELKLSALDYPPYHVQSVPTFPQEMLLKAEKLAIATNLFYSAGRAVSWFHIILSPLRCKPSVFLSRFVNFLENEDSKYLTIENICKNHKEIEKLQIAFVEKEYKNSNLQRLLPAVVDCIRLNGAFSRAYGEGESCQIKLMYHPEDIFSPYIQDLNYFCKNAQRKNYLVQISPGKNAPKWKILK